MAKVLWIGMMLVSSSLSAMDWFPGIVVLASGEVLTGEITRQSDDLILFRSGEELTVLPAHKVSSYRFYDAAERINRKFVSMGCIAAGVRFQYFEKVLSGPLTVLRQQQKFSEKFDEDGGQFRYYLRQGGELALLTQFKRRYYETVKSSLEQHAVEFTHLNPNEAADVINLIRMYNQLPTGPIAAM